MKESVAIYGFGSFFSSAGQSRDIDILIVHKRVDSTSVDFALRCKGILRDLLPAAHFTILSEPEEQEVDFINRCNAEMLTLVIDIEPDAQLASLASRLNPLGPGRQALVPLRVIPQQ